MNLKEINDMLNSYIRPQTFPVAIRLYEASEKIPDKARIPKRDLGTAIPVCQGTGLARRFGWTVAIGNEDQSCPNGLFVLGFIPGESYLDGSSGEAAGVSNKENLARIAQHVSRVEYGKYRYFVAAPLEKATFEPHVILIYGNPAQIVRLAQGAIAATGKPLDTPTIGGIACSSFIRTMLTDECQVILAGAGDRFFALTQDHELAFTIPWSKAEMVIKGVEQGHKSGMYRYPTPSLFRFDGVLPPMYYRWTDNLRKEQEKK